jgi:serine/threonine-protein kinase
VADFGIAKAVAAAAGSNHHSDRAESAKDRPVTALTQLGTAVGTPAYMAPEQAAGDPEVDHRADLYAWGLIAWEALAGRHPFADRKSVLALIGAQLMQTPAPLASARADVPPALAALVARCLAKNPAERPIDAGEVLRAIEAVSLTSVEPPTAGMSAPRELAGPATLPSIAVREQVDPVS